MKHIYLGFAFVGALVPYLFFIPFLAENGLDLTLFAEQLFANGPAGGFSADLLVSSVVFWIFLFRQKEIKQKPFIVILNLTIGLSCALPYYFYRRLQDLSD